MKGDVFSLDEILAVAGFERKMKRYEQVGGKRKWRLQLESYERKSLII